MSSKLAIIDQKFDQRLGSTSTTKEIHYVEQHPHHPHQPQQPRTHPTYQHKSSFPRNETRPPHSMAIYPPSSNAEIYPDADFDRMDQSPNPHLKILKKIQYCLCMSEIMLQPAGPLLLLQFRGSHK